MTEKAQNADFRRKNRRFSQIQPFSWRFKHLEGAGNRRFSQKTEDFRRKAQETADWAPSPEVRHLLLSPDYIAAPDFFDNSFWGAVM